MWWLLFGCDDEVKESTINPESYVYEASCPDEPTVTVSAAPTWSDDVAPIVAANCLSCHVEGGIGPFALDTYEVAAPMAAAMAASVAARSMPPWPPGTCEDCPTIQHDRSLTEQEIGVLRAWSDAGAPAGAGGAAPAAASLPTLARVDATRDIGADYTPPDSGGDTYRCFVVDAASDDDAWLTGYTVRPGEPKVVHHVLLYGLDTEAGADTVVDLDADESGPGYDCFGGPGVNEATLLAAWAPGAGATTFPAGTGLRLYGGRKMVLQVHYNVSGGTFPDRSAIDLMVDNTVSEPASILKLSQTDLALEPGEAEVVRTLDYTVPAGGSGAKVYAVAPHMHALGSRFSVTLDDACIMDVPEWDFHWQSLYFFDTPIELGAGQNVRMSCTFNTTSATAVTNFGENTTDEMCIGFVYVTAG